MNIIIFKASKNKKGFSATYEDTSSAFNEICQTTSGIWLQRGKAGDTCHVFIGKNRPQVKLPKLADEDTVILEHAHADEEGEDAYIFSNPERNWQAFSGRTILSSGNDIAANRLKEAGLPDTIDGLLEHFFNLGKAEASGAEAAATAICADPEEFKSWLGTRSKAVFISTSAELLSALKPFGGKLETLTFEEADAKTVSNAAFWEGKSIVVDFSLEKDKDLSASSFVCWLEKQLRDDLGKPRHLVEKFFISGTYLGGFFRTIQQQEKRIYLEEILLKLGWQRFTTAGTQWSPDVPGEYGKSILNMLFYLLGPCGLSIWHDWINLGAGNPDQSRFPWDRKALESLLTERRVLPNMRAYLEERFDAVRGKSLSDLIAAHGKTEKKAPLRALPVWRYIFSDQVETYLNIWTPLMHKLARKYSLLSGNKRKQAIATESIHSKFLDALNSDSDPEKFEDFLAAIFNGTSATLDYYGSDMSPKTQIINEFTKPRDLPKLIHDLGARFEEELPADIGKADWILAELIKQNPDKKHPDVQFIEKTLKTPLGIVGFISLSQEINGKNGEITTIEDTIEDKGNDMHTEAFILGEYIDEIRDEEILKLTLNEGNNQANRAVDAIVAALSGPLKDLDAVDIAGLRVLLIEDQAEWRAPISASLRAQGAVVDEAASYMTALKSISLNKYDIAILDLQLPKTEGSEDEKTLICNRTRGEILFPALIGLHIPAIVLSSHLPSLPKSNFSFAVDAMPKEDVSLEPDRNDFVGKVLMQKLAGLGFRKQQAKLAYGEIEIIDDKVLVGGTEVKKTAGQKLELLKALLMSPNTDVPVDIKQPKNVISQLKIWLAGDVDAFTAATKCEIHYSAAGVKLTLKL